VLTLTWPVLVRIYEKLNLGLASKLPPGAKPDQLPVEVKKSLIEAVGLSRGTHDTHTTHNTHTHTHDRTRTRWRGGRVLTCRRRTARWAVVGAAPISPDVLRFFDSLGLTIWEVYGQSEDCGPTSCNVPGKIKFGTHLVLCARVRSCVCVRSLTTSSQGRRVRPSRAWR
jgi:long-subunit acyl-CoA synthetase (AMP-forming)